MQTVQFCILALSNENCLIERVPAFSKPAQGDEDIGKEMVSVARGCPCFAPTAWLGLDASFQDQICRGDIRLDLPPKLLLEGGAVL